MNSPGLSSLTGNYAWGRPTVSIQKKFPELTISYLAFSQETGFALSARI